MPSSSCSLCSSAASSGSATGWWRGWITADEDAGGRNERNLPRPMGIERELPPFAMRLVGTFLHPQ
ncbi:exported hypothetical protein [Mesorhizobium plurifarium]|uniref:Uncharacterized protein n=1 Tax=Mesorhizobium plurifarium TaxID=69974 RepID=A0A090D9F7_MESPL|nr:exported hypothetical protein [Mesorhizobium plurifarium]